MEMLFTEEITHSGYKLEYLEIYNWGGFHEKIWRIEPGCSSILVTGANGSGKTTLADALVTLLVPPVRRHYNQSSGSEKKRDRTEESYVLGAYGSLRNEEGSRSTVSHLREKNSYSILVAVFYNQLNKSHFTLAQIRRFTASGLQREYITADAPLNIQEHLQPLDAKREYRKRLEGIPGITWHDSFSKYQQYMIRALGLRSEKALNLFSQIVGVKQIENLNSFIRTHMIEEPGMEEDFAKLKGNYQDLLQTHNKIEMAEIQLEHLKTIRDTGLTYRTILEESENLHRISEGIPFYFAARRRETAEELYARESELLNRYTADKASLEEEKSQILQELESVNVAIAQDSTSGRLREIENDISTSGERMQERKQRHTRYLGCADVLALPAPSSLDIFIRNKVKASQIMDDAVCRITKTEKELRGEERKHEDLADKSAELKTEIGSLQSRRSNIPFTSLQLRRQLCDALAITPSDLPFAGELVQVRAEESRWELAAERLLHNFALSILVPESLYRQTTEYINNTDLKGRLVYFRIPEDTATQNIEELFAADLATLPAKLEGRPDTPFSTWLASTVLDRFDYLCTDDLKEFSHASHAVTSNGLVKGNRRHEKDDRPGRWGRENYVLGWDNSRKIAIMKDQLNTNEELISELSRKIRGLHNTISNLREQIRSGQTVTSFEDYSEINWAKLAERISNLETQRKSLLESADALKSLKKKKEDLEESRSGLEKKRDNLIQAIALRQQKIEALQTEIEESTEVLTKLNSSQKAELEEIYPAIEKLFARSKPAKADPLTILRTQRIDAMNEARQQIENSSKKIDKTGRDLTNAMNRFLAPGPEIARSFPGWSSETHHLSANPDYLKDYIAVYKRIEKDDLPKYKKEFRKFMNERMFENIISFSNTLDSTERKIKDDINHLNRSLKSVSYSKQPETYIILDTRTTRDIAVQDFRALLKSSMGNPGELARRGTNGDSVLESSFIRIQELINKLSEDDNWRKKVLDVRNWLEFGASERYRDNDEEKQYYEDSMSLSGGEKAKLAYTILASAIAYQYGLNREQHEQTGRSFRFVIVDEIFSKVDPENSEYAMNLFRTMGLQLMIVTPLDRINIVEKHIGSVCFIEKQRDYAVPHSLSMEAYHSMQEQ